MSEAKTTTQATLKIGTKSYPVKLGQPFQDIYKEHDTDLVFGCREGLCGTCKIRVIEHPENLPPMGAKEKQFLDSIMAKPNERLACQNQVQGDVAIEIADFGMDAIFD